MIFIQNEIWLIKFLHRIIRFLLASYSYILVNFIGFRKWSILEINVYLWSRISTEVSSLNVRGFGEK